MEQSHRLILKSHTSLLVGDSGIELTKEFIDGLISVGIFTKTWISKFMGEESNEHQVNRMLELLPKRGPNAFGQFVGVLENDYPWLADKLKKATDTDETFCDDGTDSAYSSANNSTQASLNPSPRGSTSSRNYMLELREEIQKMTLENARLKLENGTMMQTMTTNGTGHQQLDNHYGGNRRHEIEKLHGTVSDLRKEMKTHPETIADAVYNTFRENEQWERLRRRTGRSYYKLH